MIIKAIAVASIFWLLPVPTAFLLKMTDRKMSCLYGYIVGALLNLLAFHVTNRILFVSGATLGMMHIGILLSVNALILFASGIIWLVKGRKLSKKAVKDESDENKAVANRIWWWSVSVVLGISVLGSYLFYVPNNATVLMAAINRLDYFPMVPGESMMSMGYYLVKLLNFTPAYAVCVVIPFMFCMPVLVLFWIMTDMMDDAKNKVVFLCAELILLFLGDGQFTYSGLVLHGLNQITNISIVLCVPLAFILSFRIFVQKKRGPVWLLVFDLVAACLLWRTTAFVSFACVVLCALIYAGRRYLPWFQPSQQ